MNSINNNIVKTLLFSLFFINSISFGQKFGDKSFYLIDSLKIDNLSYQDSILLDSTLNLYHKTIKDTVKFEILQYITDQCWDSQVWPKYNLYLIEKINQKLVTNCPKPERKKTMSILAGAISNVGFLFDQKGDLLNALNCYHKSLNIYEQLEDSQGQSTLFNNLGVIYSMVGDTTNAFIYHKKSLQIKKEIKDNQGIAMSYNNIGTVYENANLPFKALEYYELSLSISKSNNELRGMAMTFDNIGDIYFSQNMNSKAYDYYLKGFNLWDKLNNDLGKSTSLDNLSNVLIALNRLDEAKNFAVKSYEIAISLDYPVDIENSSKTLAKIFELEKNYQESLKYTNIHIKMRDKTKNENNNNIALKKSMQYEYEKETLKDSLKHEKERELHSIRIKEKETQAYLLYSGIFLLILVLIIAIKSFIRKKNDNNKIKEQKIEVEAQKLKIENQHFALATTHKEISDSINYAKRIQDAILPTKEELNNYLKNGFVFFKPKDIVSGDFYWTEKINDNIIFGVADCTGHGVPGAIVSVVCHNALNRAVREFNLRLPNKILDKTREIVINTFESENNDSNIKDGMDISICNWNIKTNEFSWAGANNPLYILRNGEKNIKIIQPDKQPVGKFELANKFTLNSIKLNSGDTFYLFSDGFMDQFGGENGKKYKYSRFREFLISISENDMETQGVLLEEEFYKWKGNTEQLDDVCVIGVQI